MDNRPVGFFDSGFGGLTALRAFRKLMPGENIIYFGDTGRMPYGAATMGIDTRRIKKSFTENGGSLEIDYVVDMEHTVVSRNIFKLNITEQKREQQWQI